ncbi:hypothetical protein GA0070616_4599 [Micromonospora nigra]|uniref:Uncharacterized protein n=1 Tax=Micromonospora nigra TaxID=145857 RepID=A0A1C6SU11_9ACTN|nr:hypothetical protein [Micromonospora nigra]SCL32957.1 hypothetical protein GA0070616_4599 [Micromonospora nigra]
MALSYHDAYGSPWVYEQEKPPTRAALRDPFPPGTRARLRDDLGGGTVRIVDRYGGGLRQVRPDNGGSDFVISGHALRRPAPIWKPGDVVVVRYGPRATPYTYVRGNGGWLVEKGREPKADEWMTAQVDAGRATPVLQAGGEPFDGGRL